MTYVIAELGNTHEGSLGLAKQMIRAAAECGADAVKIQTHIFSAESLPSAPNPPYFKDESRESYFNRTSFSKEQYLELIDVSEKECGIHFLSSPFSVEAVEFLDDIGMRFFKIPSGEVSNILLLRKAARTKKPIFLSSGMSSWDELDLAVNTLLESGCRDLTILQCASRYPCLPRDAGLNILEEMSVRYKTKVGYSDHTMGLSIPLAAVAMGAELVEKHFTLSQKMYGSDAKNSMEPDEFRQLVTAIREIDDAMNNRVEKNIVANELVDMKRIFEKSIVSVTDILEGEKIQEHMLSMKKPGNGIPGKYFDSVVGTKAVRNITQDSLLQADDLLGFNF